MPAHTRLPRSRRGERKQGAHARRLGRPTAVRAARRLASPPRARQSVALSLTDDILAQFY